MAAKKTSKGRAQKTVAAKKAARTTTTASTTPKAAKKTAGAAQRPARVAGRVTPKVSPLKGTPVTEWVKMKTSGWQTQVVTRLLGIAERAMPDAKVSIKWGQPVIELNGPLAWLKPAKAHVSFGFWRGAELTDEAGILEGDGKRMMHLKLTSADDVDEKRLVTFLREAADLNRKKGDPTKR